jgi:hypothetical protein
MDEFEYRIFVDNEMKRNFFLTMSCIKKRYLNNPIHLFLIGGARIGKTFNNLVNRIYDIFITLVHHIIIK